MKYYPTDTKVAVKLDKVIMHREKMLPDERMSSRMVKCASMLDRGEFIGWQLFMPKTGLAEPFVFGSGQLDKSDLEWITENTASTVSVNSEKTTEKYDEMQEVYELYVPQNSSAHREIGFNNQLQTVETAAEAEEVKWPVFYSSQFHELMRVFRNTGAMFRVAVGSADKEEQRRCAKQLMHEWKPCKIDPENYIGNPVRMRVLLRLSGTPSIRLVTVLDEAIPGIRIKHLGTITNGMIKQMWEFPLQNAPILPDYAARIIMMEPEIIEETTGLRVCNEPVKEMLASHDNPKSKDAIVIGKAEDTSGIRRKITIGDFDLRRHYQIVGQSGCGKSTLLANIILSAIAQGKGLTFFDPHGSTIDVILQSVPEKYADRIRVVRIGDAENPVPLNIWDSDDPEKEERNINDLCELFRDIFDPDHQGFVGPRYERWLSTFCKASIAFLGRRASLESITILSRNQDNMRKLYRAIFNKYPEIAEIIKSEYGTDRSSDFVATLSWYLCKFQRLTSVEQLRKTLGAGGNALDFNHSIDTNTVTLIDLASPVIGAHGSRIIGTLLLMKLWNAAMTRCDREKNHLIVLDEASLWTTNPLPRMCSEARKFGISLILSHQHAGQLTREIRDALEGNSANFSTFRLSPKDAADAAIRFDDPRLQVGLTRMDAFKAVTTLSVDGIQTAPFTLHIEKPKAQKNGERIAKMIEQKSIEQLVDPYRHLSALTPFQIQDLLDRAEQDTWEKDLAVPKYLDYVDDFEDLDGLLEDDPVSPRSKRQRQTDRKAS